MPGRGAHLPACLPEMLPCIHRVFAREGLPKALSAVAVAGQQQQQKRFLNIHEYQVGGLMRGAARADR